MSKYFRPEGCSSPNEVAAKLGISGEAVKNWIYTGKLRAAKAMNGYWWVREDDLKEFLESRSVLEFRYHRLR